METSTNVTTSYQKEADKKLTKKKTYNPYGFSGKTSIFMHLLLGTFAFLCIFPFLYVIIISLSNEQSLAENGYQLIPEQWSFEAYKYLWEMKAQVVRAYGVTILVTVLGTFISVTVIALYAYAISRKQFIFRKQFTFIAFFTMLFSGGMVPFYIVMTQFLDLKNSMWALILPMAVNAFYIIIMRTFFLRSVPEAILESARIDGAGEWRIFLTIVLPLSVPGIATIALFNTLAYWNDWFNALLFIDDPNLIPLQSLLMRIENNMDFIKQNAMLSNQNSSILESIPQDSARMAMVVIATLPIALSYPFFQKYFIKGLTIGGVKD
ncbi:carbohydrate ABC transporter permease [Rossellomorea aquimaris]|jgi:putative aldouronate transport system permease protein|uniref:Carbohydrate ABC transporter permease n=2 Tax=Bacillaceae TaxID=186817 RepID=A0A5D4TNC2_9BACI|nr:carbohydrate ABC transporter permease [Rossellomorea aquimaris]TYS83048.1 carbohydrate ABC transporter permease [Rossellomorea aquimaris]